MKKKLVVLSAMSTMAVALAGHALAEEKKSEVTTAIMDEVVVTATKTTAQRHDIVNAVVLLDADDIKESGARSLGQALANEPGLDWRTYGNYGGASEEIHIRGMGGDATQVMVNGVVANSPSLGLADVGLIPLNSIGRVEVVKGPGSLLYGSGAMGGTVNIITKQPEKGKISLLAEAGYGTQETYRLSAENGMFVSSGFGYYLTANHKETDGFRSNSDLNHNDASLNLVLHEDDKFDVSLYGDLVDREYGVPGPKPPAGTLDYSIGNEKFYDSESASLINQGEEEDYRTALTVKSRLTDWLNLSLKGDSTVQENYNYARFNVWGSDTASTVTNTIQGMEGNADLAPLSWLGLLMGSEYRDFNYENEQQTLDADGAAVAGGATSFERRVFTNGTFAELSLKPVQFLKATAGYRHEKHSRFGHEDVSRYGLVVNPLPGTTFKVNHGNHFKAPTMNDLFWPDDGFMIGNLKLKPETGWHTDLTVEQSVLDNHVFASISYFKWDITDKIAWGPVPGSFYWTPTNLYTYEATGWEMNAKIGPYYSLLLDASLTLLDAEEEKSPTAIRPALNKPERQFKCDLKYFSDSGLTSTLSARYVSDRPGYYRTDADRVPEIVLDSYWTMDLKIEQVVAEHFRLSLIGANLFDTGYNTYITIFTDQTTWATTQEPYPGAGRSVFAQVGYEF